jgi:hypothetical protein
MSKYAPTTNPGDTRVRCYRLRINNPPNAAPSVIIYEEEMIKTAAGGEQHLADMGAFTVPFDPAAVVELRDLVTDQPLGATKEAGEIMAWVYAWTRTQQTARDEAQQNPAPGPTEPQ